MKGICIKVFDQFLPGNYYEYYYHSEFIEKGDYIFVDQVPIVESGVYDIYNVSDDGDLYKLQKSIFEKYFIDLKELRKLKLNKINESQV